MKLSINIMGVEDIKDVDSLLKHKRSILKNNNRDILHNSIAEKIKDKNYIILGLREDGNLRGIVGIFKWISLPYYSVTDLFIDTQYSVKRYNAYITQALKTIMNLMEKEGRFQFYILTLVRPFQKKVLKNNKMWEVSKKYEPFARYNVTLEVIVKAHEKPEYVTYWKLMGSKTWPEDIWIRKYTLKNEFILHNLNKY